MVVPVTVLAETASLVPNTVPVIEVEHISMRRLSAGEPSLYNRKSMYFKLKPADTLSNVATVSTCTSYSTSSALGSVPVKVKAGVVSATVSPAVGSVKTTVGESSGIRAKPITPQAYPELIASVPPSIVPALAIAAVTKATPPSVPVELP